FNWLPALFGGRQSARSVHFILAFSFALFTFGHVMMVITTGMINNMRSMVSGWYREKFHLATAMEAPVPKIEDAAAPAETSEADAPRVENGGADEQERP